MPGTRKRYRVLTQDGADFAGRALGVAPVEIGTKVELEIYADAAKATVAAGWLEETPESEKTKGGDK